MTINNSQNLSLKNYYKQIGFHKENNFYSMKRLKKELLLLATKSIEKIPDPNNAKKYYNSHLRRKNTKSAKR